MSKVTYRVISIWGDALTTINGNDINLIGLGFRLMVLRSIE